ncbi:MAG: 5'/3'-nucleotidase SurE [Syntrophomonadaceae bacterium]|nr:5'/3'-nucleotidase SurE [Syntrophomonadaceae bacterium]
MRILLTNDDGIYSPGIHQLAETLAEMGDVYVVAPDRERSATGHGITVYKPILIERMDSLIQSAKAAWAVYGTPADCVKLAVAALLPEPPDLVVSGINRGANLGWDVLYSGTVSAAMEGVIMGVASVAVSLTSHRRDLDYSFAARFTRAVCRQIEKDGPDRETIININVPDVPRPDIKGMRITRLGKRRYQNIFQERRDPRGQTYYWLGGEVVEENQETDSDVVAVGAGFISVTPIHFDLTDYGLIDKYRHTYRDYIDHFQQTDD